MPEAEWVELEVAEAGAKSASRRGHGRRRGLIAAGAIGIAIVVLGLGVGWYGRWVSVYELRDAPTSADGGQLEEDVVGRVGGSVDLSGGAKRVLWEFEGAVERGGLAVVPEGGVEKMEGWPLGGYDPNGSFEFVTRETQGARSVNLRRGEYVLGYYVKLSEGDGEWRFRLEERLPWWSSSER